MSAPSSPLLLEQPFDRPNPLVEGTWSHSFGVPVAWDLPREFRRGVRVFEAVANDDQGAGLLEVAHSAGKYYGRLAFAILGRRIAVIHRGRAIANVRQATAESLADAIRAGLQRVPMLDERGRDGETEVSILEQLAALDLVEDASAGEASLEEIREARAWVWSGAAGRRGALFLRLLDAELGRRASAVVVVARPVETGGRDLVEGTPLYWDRERGLLTATPTAERVHATLVDSAPSDPQSSDPLELLSCRECGKIATLETFTSALGNLACPGCGSARLRFVGAGERGSL